MLPDGTTIAVVLMEKDLRAEIVGTRRPQGG
jgi:hypothetical protein